MQRKAASTWIFLFGLLILSGPILADGDFWDVFNGQQPSFAAQDRNFEARVYSLLEQQAGAVSEYVEVTRFGNTILITGEMESLAQVTAIDELVLDIAGIKREKDSGVEVVPEKDRECGGRAVMGNAKRKMIVTADKDCSSLHSDKNQLARGKIYNHLATGESDPARKVAAARLLLAKAVVELVDAGYTQLLDRAAMRLVAQDGVFYILGSPGDVEATRIKAVLMTLPGVSDVTFYTE